MKHRLLRDVGKARVGSVYDANGMETEQCRCTCRQWNYTFKSHTAAEEEKMFRSFQQHEFQSGKR